MKKFLFCALLLCATMLKAQISRSINGIELGGERTNLINHLKESGEIFLDESEFDANDNSLLTSLTFSGIEWVWTTVTFREGKTHVINMLNRTYDQAVADNYYDTFKRLSYVLYTKFSAYGLGATFSEVDGGADGKVAFCDGKTYVTLILEHRLKGESILLLRYEDVAWKK